MSQKLESLSQRIAEKFGEKLLGTKLALGELTIEVPSNGYKDLMLELRDNPDFAFEEIIDLCGVDYLEYGEGARSGKRYAAVSHLLSIKNNNRLRVRVFAENDAFPVVDSIASVWTSANWFEREAFDLYGIVFEGHEDLRRILTDYGFIGHPFRKDFPITGHVEMRYDPDQGRVVYQPVTIEPRENTPRVIRESTFGG
jgi:NADH-quinone oxidoreductase subunit C